MLFDPDSQTCDLLRRAMEEANAQDVPGRAPPVIVELILEVIFIRRLNRETTAMSKALARMALGDEIVDDLIATRALRQIERMEEDWELAGVIEAQEQHTPAFADF